MTSKKTKVCSINGIEFSVPKNSAGDFAKSLLSDAAGGNGIKAIFSYVSNTGNTISVRAMINPKTVQTLISNIPNELITQDTKGGSEVAQVGEKAEDGEDDEKTD